MDLVSDPLVVGSQKQRGGYRSIKSQKMIQPVRKLSSATFPLVITMYKETHLHPAT
jgi:hypothetical protein